MQTAKFLKSTVYAVPVILYLFYVVTLAIMGPWFQENSCIIDIAVWISATLYRSDIIDSTFAHVLANSITFGLSRIFDFILFIPFAIILFFTKIPKIKLYLLLSLSIIVIETYGIVFLSDPQSTKNIHLYGFLTFQSIILPSIVLLDSLFGIRNRGANVS